MAAKARAATGANSVFGDLFPAGKAAVHERRARLFIEIQEIVASRKLTQSKLVKLTGLGQPEVSKLLNGKLSRFSLEKLISILEGLGASVEITVKRTA